MGLSFGLGIAIAGRLSGRDHHSWVILGDGEAENNTVSLRARSGEQVADIALDEFITNITAEISEKSSQPNLV